MTPEHKIMNEIRLYCGENNMLCFRCNVGTVPTAQGTYFNTGLPEGFSDLLVCYSGKTIFCECKTKTGKQREAQIAFQKAVEEQGFKYVVARSLDDFINNL